MLRYSLTYGGIIGVIVIALMALTLLTMGPEAATSSQAAGYVTMLAVLSLVFVGIKRYRDAECGGVIRFIQAAKVGAGIAGVAAIAYAIAWEGVLAATDYAFIESYSRTLSDAVIAQALPPAEQAAQLAEIEASMASYRNPLLRLPISFIEIFPVGLVVALGSALVLKNPRVLRGRAVR